MKKVFLFLMMVAVSVNLLNAQWSSNPQEPLGISDNGKYNQDLFTRRFVATVRSMSLGLRKETTLRLRYICNCWITQEINCGLTEGLS